MRVEVLQSAVAFSALVFALAAPAVAADKSETRARTDYLLHCSGCHGQDGTGKPSAGIPRFTDQVGYFLNLPEGRAFLMQVPGLLSANMPDDRAAAVVTWMIKEFAGPSMPEKLEPYTAEEAKRYKAERPADIMARRNEIYAKLLAQGIKIE
jgi:mono/diheme cytochrome c family protein